MWWLQCEREQLMKQMSELQSQVEQQAQELQQFADSDPETLQRMMEATQVSSIVSRHCMMLIGWHHALCPGPPTGLVASVCSAHMQPLAYGGGAAAAVYMIIKLLVLVLVLCCQRQRDESA